MIDISKTIEPRSDQLNADDLLVGSKTIKITSVKEHSAEQPIAIHYEGDNGKPYLPCLSMRRVLVKAWNKDGDKYIGKSLTLFADPNVKWASMAVGGIRISHMSHIDGTLRIMLTKSRGQKAMCEIKPLETAPENKLTEADFKALSVKIGKAKDMAELSVVAAEIKALNLDKAGHGKIGDVYKKAVAFIRDGGAE